MALLVDHDTVWIKVVCLVLDSALTDKDAFLEEQLCIFLPCLGPATEKTVIFVRC